MDKIGFISERAPEFMLKVHKIIAENSWVKQVVSADLDYNNDSMEMAVHHSDMVFDWVKENVEGKFARVSYSRAYGFELESDIVLFHLTWGKG
jgi:hypothetical protein